MARPRIALISNPKSTGNLAQLPRIRAFCSDHPDIFHYEIEEVAQIGEAMQIIARISPAVNTGTITLPPGSGLEMPRSATAGSGLERGRVLRCARAPWRSDLSVMRGLARKRVKAARSHSRNVS